MKIGIISDRPVLTHTLHQAVSLLPTHHVVWIAESGPTAVDLCASDPPDVALLVLPSAGMDGAEVTGRIMVTSPCPILIVTESLRTNAGAVFEAMQRGAREVVDLPPAGVRSLQESAAALLGKMALVSKRLADPRIADTRIDPTSGGVAVSECGRSGRDVLVAIGASAGGPAAVAAILSGLPKDFPAGIVVVQHVADMFVPGMAEWLSGVCGRQVIVPKAGDRVSSDRVMVAGAGGHLVVTTSGTVAYTPEPRHCVYRPSVDVFLESASRLWRGDVVGVLLTGMGKDGAVGLKALRDKGHHTIAQDQASSVVYGMPKAAVALDAALDVLPLDRIAARLGEIVGSGSRS